MTKNELAAAVAAKTKMSIKDSEKAVSALIDTMTESLANGEKLQLFRFGSFEIRERAAHVGRNLKTNEEIQIPAKQTVVFKASKALKDAVQK